LRDIKLGQYYLWAKRFNSINELVTFHRANSVSKLHTILLRSMGSAFAGNSLVQALFDFTPQEEGELGFQRGDIITGWQALLFPHTESWLASDKLCSSDEPRGRELVGGEAQRTFGSVPSHLRLPVQQQRRRGG